MQRQVRYELIPVQRDEDGNVLERACYYVADFVYAGADGYTVVEDVKGIRTKAYLMKRKLMLYRYGISIQEDGLVIQMAKKGYLPISFIIQ